MPNEQIMRAFIEGIAALNKDQECARCGKDGEEPNPACPGHEPWEMHHDDAVDTLHALISGARKLAQEFKKYDAEQNSPEAEAYRTGAREHHCRDGELEVDEGAVVSFGGDPGAYVASWTWVSDKEAGLPDEEEETT